MVDAAPPGQQQRRPFQENELHRLFGLAVDEARPGFARVVMDTNHVTGGQGESAVGGGVGGSVHGGILAAMADIAALQAVIASLEPGDRPAGTADLNITYLRPALGGRVTADASILRKGRQLIVIEVSIADAEGRLCARSKVLYALRRDEPARHA